MLTTHVFDVNRLIINNIPICKFIPLSVQSHQPIESVDLIVNDVILTRFPLEFCNKLCNYEKKVIIILLS